MRLKAMVGTVLAFAAMSGAAGAATAEVSVVTGRTSGDGFTVDSQSFIARYYLNGLQEADAPLDLQPFFQRANSVAFELNSIDGFLRTTGPSASFFVGDFLIAPRIIQYHDFDRINTWSLDLGYHFMDNLRVSLPNAVFGILDSDVGDFVESDASFKSIRVDYVHRMGQANLMLAAQWIDVDAAEGFLLRRMGFDWLNFISYGTYFEAKYYPTKEIGYGGILHLNDDNELASINVGASWWAAPNVGLSANLIFHTGDDLVFDDMTTLTLGLTSRF